MLCQSDTLIELGNRCQGFADSDLTAVRGEGVCWHCFVMAVASEAVVVSLLHSALICNSPKNGQTREKNIFFAQKKTNRFQHLVWCSDCANWPIKCRNQNLYVQLALADFADMLTRAILMKFCRLTKE